MALIDPDGDLPDPIRFADLTHDPGRVADIVRRRSAQRWGPGVVSVLQWPKSRAGRRPMACMDPFDLVTYRGLVGRQALTLAAAVDSTVVLSSRLEELPPGWRVEHFSKPTGERRRLGYELLDVHRVLGTLDILEFYPRTTRPALETLPCHIQDPAGFGALLDWLDSLHSSSPVTGLPIGPGGSELLGNALLAPADAALAALGVPFLRYMDDTWVFLSSEEEFPRVLTEYAGAAGALGLSCNLDKCDAYDYEEGRRKIRASILHYADGSFNVPGSEDHDVAVQLLEYALEDPDQRVDVLRNALGRFRGSRTREVFPHLVADPTLVALAPSQWRKIIREAVGIKTVARATGAPDWVIEQVTEPLTDDNAHRSAVLLQAVAPVIRPSRDDASALFDAAQAAEGRAEPVQIGAAHAWSRCSQAFRAGKAVEAAEAASTVSSKRGWAITVAAHDRSSRAKFIDGVRHAHEDLDATAEWLSAA